MSKVVFLSFVIYNVYKEAFNQYTLYRLSKLHIRVIRDMQLLQNKLTENLKHLIWTHGYPVRFWSSVQSNA